ncbi:uncharacterized threonine-rich GPI-anchored glycoprotein PJ4664.02 isoform X1 [Oncorhynchus kisutch]|uniref:uncharacterized threonine-rich GPI-anchored glycoprotein PJ4664.02 isoform X1 n=1 Tax=Oncorhynchus kisutch TaxID=8019 RepID=UPI0012DD9BE0|nr:uncharacterized threonine-rich GPI-anchored glycoprotein PJ4664.02-like isoform X1 [Oncorhynchus kisutch]
MMSWYNKVYPVLLWSLFLLYSEGSQNFTLTEDRGSNMSINTAATQKSSLSMVETHTVMYNSSTREVGGAITVGVNASEGTMMTSLGPTLSPLAMLTSSGTTPSPLTTNQTTSQTSSSHGPSSTSDLLSTTTPSSTIWSSITELNTTSEVSSTTGPSSNSGSFSTNVSASTPGPSSTIVSSSTPGPSSTIVSSSTPGPSSTIVSSSTPGPSSTNFSSSANETFLTTFPPISTTDNSTNSSSGVLIPKMKTEKVPILIPKTTTIMTTLPSKKDPSGGGGLPCSPTRRDGLVSQCLIAIASLAAVATFFMVSCIILCTKYSSRKHRYRVGTNNRGTEMVCISALLHDDNGPHWRPHIPKSNGALLPGTELDSDEEGGDDVTLHSFLPDNEQRV